MKNENNDNEIMSDGDAVGLAFWGLLLASIILFYAGFQGARILTIGGEIGRREFVTEKITRSYEIKTRNHPTDYYQCFNHATEGEQCIQVGIAASDIKIGEALETIRIWDGNVYHISDPYLENMSLYFIQFIVFGLLALFCLFKITFPRFQILRKFNDTRTVKLFDN